MASLIVEPSTYTLIRRPPFRAVNKETSLFEQLVGWWVDGPIPVWGGQSLTLTAGSPTVDCTPDGGLGIRSDVNDENYYATATASLKLSLPITYSVWFLPLGAITSNAWIFGCTYDNGPNDPWIGWGLAAHDSNGFYPCSNSAGSFYSYNSLIQPVTGRIEHWTVTMTASVGITAYRNGLYLGTNGAAKSNPTYHSTARMGLAGYGPGFARNTNSIIWDCRVWARELNKKEIFALYDPRTRHSLYWAPSQRVIVQLPSGGSVYSDTVTLASAAAVAHAAAAIFPKSLSFATAATTAQSSVAIFGTSLSLAAGATAGAAGPVTATHSLNLPSAAAVSLAAAHVLAEALALAAGATAAPSHAATITPSVTLPAEAGYAPGSTLAALNNLSLPAGATFTPAAAHVLADTLSLATGATFTPEAVHTLLTSLSLSATAAEQAASTLVAVSTLSLAAQAGLVPSAGAVTIDESVSLSSAAAFALAQTAVLGAVQTYAAAAGLTGSSAGVLGNALALDVLAALSSSPTGTYHPSVALAVAAVFGASYSYTSAYTYTVLKVAAEALRQAAATTESLTDAGVTGEDLD